jgi:hypothetical protein
LREEGPNGESRGRRRRTIACLRCVRCLFLSSHSTSVSFIDVTVGRSRSLPVALPSSSRNFLRYASQILIAETRTRLAALSRALLPTRLDTRPSRVSRPPAARASLAALTSSQQNDQDVRYRYARRITAESPEHEKRDTRPDWCVSCLSPLAIACSVPRCATLTRTRSRILDAPCLPH